MIAFKGFSMKDGALTSVHGNGVREKCTFEVGKTYTEEKSKTRQTGWHCCENIFGCFTYYPFCPHPSATEDNRFFMIEASGDIDEEEEGVIACTRITILEELTPFRLVFHGMKYMVEHPARERWEKKGTGWEVQSESAQAERTGYFAIARGKHPRVRGAEGAILGLILEPEKGKITAVKLFTANMEQAGKWYTLTKDRELVEAGKETGDEEKGN